jgi:ubiquinone/menaquinone biosynthesis C-methylase UbiE
MAKAEFTPAAGRFLPTSAYDRLLALLTREATWRARLLEALAPKPGERILDVGSGTGSFAILIKQKEPHAIVVGLDPDPEARRIATAKATEAGVEVAWQSGFARDAANFGQFDKVVSSLVFHQVPVEEKRAGLAAMFKAARTGGRVLIVDYAEQRSWLMRQAFKIVQSADGRTNTQPNADGFIERELVRICGAPLISAWALDTPTGAISMFSATRAQSATAPFPAVATTSMPSDS